MAQTFRCRTSLAFISCATLKNDSILEVGNRIKCRLPCSVPIRKFFISSLASRSPVMPYWYVDLMKSLTTAIMASLPELGSSVELLKSWHSKNTIFASVPPMSIPTKGMVRISKETIHFHKGAVTRYYINSINYQLNFLLYETNR